jgi:hypothetical protein
LYYHGDEIKEDQMADGLTAKQEVGEIVVDGRIILKRTSWK